MFICFGACVLPWKHRSYAAVTIATRATPGRTSFPSAFIMATSSYSLSGHSSVTLGTTKSIKASKLPFEELPNLPKPVIPKIDLGLRRADVKAMLEYEYGNQFHVLNCEL